MDDEELDPIQKPVKFLGDSLENLRSFPDAPKQQIGFDLDKVQRGKAPSNAKSMSTIGSGVYEIRVQDPSGQYRAIYIAKLEEAVYILHCFKKTTQQTTEKDKNIAKARLKSLLQ